MDEISVERNSSAFRIVGRRNIGPNFGRNLTEWSYRFEGSGDGCEIGQITGESDSIRHHMAPVENCPSASSFCSTMGHYLCSALVEKWQASIGLNHGTLVHG